MTSPAKASTPSAPTPATQSQGVLEIFKKLDVISRQPVYDDRSRTGVGGFLSLLVPALVVAYSAYLVVQIANSPPQLTTSIELMSDESSFDLPELTCIAANGCRYTPNERGNRDEDDISKACAATAQPARLPAGGNGGNAPAPGPAGTPAGGNGGNAPAPGPAGTPPSNGGRRLLGEAQDFGRILEEATKDPKGRTCYIIACGEFDI